MQAVYGVGKNESGDKVQQVTVQSVSYFAEPQRPVSGGFNYEAAYGAPLGVAQISNFSGPVAQNNACEMSGVQTATGKVTVDQDPVGAYRSDTNAAAAALACASQVVQSNSVHSAAPYAQSSNFQIEKKVGRGQFSVVYKATNILTGTSVALKKVQVSTTRLCESFFVKTNFEELLRHCPEISDSEFCQLSWFFLIDSANNRPFVLLHTDL